tara:strand:- start:166 stop:756 length:591 start_codon:yes stop_codon:yes gene_type:complete
MEITGEYRISASRVQVWEALNDPDVLRACIPGLENLDKKSDTEFAAVVTTRVGPVKVRFEGSVTLSDLDPPHGYQIVGEGQGGVAGFAKGTCQVSLGEEGEETLLRYRADAQVGGKLAQIGSRMISGVAKKTANDFFSAFAKQMAISTDSGTSSVKETKLADPTVLDTTTNRPAIAPAYWIGGLIIITGFLLWVYS